MRHRVGQMAEIGDIHLGLEPSVCDALLLMIEWSSSSGGVLCLLLGRENSRHRMQRLLLSCRHDGDMLDSLLARQTSKGDPLVVCCNKTCRLLENRMRVGALVVFGQCECSYPGLYLSEKQEFVCRN